MIALLFLLLPFASSSFIPAPPLPPFTAINSTTFCKRTSTVTYEDPWGPIFTENTYACSFPSPSPHTVSTQKPLTVPAPYSHVAGQRGADPMVASRGTLETLETAYTRMLLQASQKLTIPSYGCELFSSPARLDETLFSNLFWGMRQLMNQTCLEPGEAREFVDIRLAWSADWRFVAVNRGEEQSCEWYQELANVAEALHYVCYFSELGTGLGERNGGIEALAWGKKEGMRWCLRYSQRGWGEKVWEEKCLGI